MVAFTAMGEGTTGTPLHKGSEAQSVGAVQTPHQTEGGICACERGWYVRAVRLHGSIVSARVRVWGGIEQAGEWSVYEEHMHTRTVYVCVHQGNYLDDYGF